MLIRKDKCVCLSAILISAVTWAHICFLRINAIHVKFGLINYPYLNSSGNMNLKNNMQNHKFGNYLCSQN